MPNGTPPGHPDEPEVARRQFRPLPYGPERTANMRLRLLGPLPFRRLSLMGFGAGAARAATVACLSTLTACLRGKLRILREAALLVRNALTALAARDGGQLAVLRKTTLRARHALPALATGFGGQPANLREPALLVRNRQATHTCNLALPLQIHRRESPKGSATILSWFVSHRYSPPQ